MGLTIPNPVFNLQQLQEGLLLKVGVGEGDRQYRPAYMVCERRLGMMRGYSKLSSSCLKGAKEREKGCGQSGKGMITKKRTWQVLQVWFPERMGQTD